MTTPDPPRLYVAPHAILRFRERIAPHLTGAEAHAAIVRGLQSRPSIQPTHNGTCLMARVRRGPASLYSFRAIVAASAVGQLDIVTVLRSGH